MKGEVSKLTQNQRKLAIVVGKASRQLNREGGFEGLDLVKGVGSGLFSGLKKGLTGGRLDMSDAAPNVALENSQIEYLKNLQSDKRGHGLYDVIAILDDGVCSRLLLENEKAQTIETELKKESVKDSAENRELYSSFLENVRQVDNAGTRAKQGKVEELKRRFEPAPLEPASFPTKVPKSSLHPPGDRLPEGGPQVQASGGGDELFEGGGGGQGTEFFPPRGSELFPPAIPKAEPVITSGPARYEDGRRDEPARGGAYGAPPARGEGGWEAPLPRGEGGRRVQFARGEGGWRAESAGGGDGWGPPPSGGAGGRRDEPDGGGGGRRDGPALGQRGWNSSGGVVSSPLLEEGDLPSLPVTRPPDLAGQAQDRVEEGGFFQKQVGDRFKTVSGAAKEVGKYVDVSLRHGLGSKEASAQLADVGAQGYGFFAAKSQSQLEKEARERRVEQELPPDTPPGFFELATNSAGAFLVDIPVHVAAASANALTFNSQGAQENIKAVVSDVRDGFLGGTPLQERDREAEERRRQDEQTQQAREAERAEAERAREVERAEAERAHRLEQRRVAAELARLAAERRAAEVPSPREFPGADATAELVFPGKEKLLRRESAMGRGNPPSVDEEEDELNLKIRKSGWKNCFKSFIPNCCSCCSCGILGPLEEEYTLKPKKSFSFEYEEELLEKVKRSQGSTREENISVGQKPSRPLSQWCTATDNFIHKKEVNKDEFIKELTFASTNEAREVSRNKTLFRTITLNQDEDLKEGSSPGNAQDKHIKIGDCEIKEINIVDLKSNAHQSRIYLDKNGVEAIKKYTESHEKLFLKYFLNDQNLTVENLLNQAPGDNTILQSYNFRTHQMEEAQKKASEASQILVERKMERGDFKFDLDDPNKEIAYVKILREIDKSGNVKKDNKVEIKTGKEFSDSLKHINIHVGDSDYIQIHLDNSDSGPKVRDNLDFYRKNSENKFDQIELKNSKHIKSSNIKIISHDNEETKFKAGNITEKKDPEEKKSSCFSCLKKAKPKIKESGVIRYEDGGWNIEFEKNDSSTSSTQSAKLIMNANGKISFDEKNPENKKIADAFRKALGDKNEVRKFKLLRDNETYEVTIGGTESKRTFRNTGNLFRGKTHGNGILKVEKISGNNLTAQGAVIDDVDDATSTTGRKSWTACFGRRGKEKGREGEEGERGR